ncbi:Hypothetical predicted protein [Lecanosticta acicola]|uniref:Uncharacterized protein n=1 Tax=Lecanosticta acicola TaxID=111012 RepID=A0AAI9EEX2_9PEZI|nr:Hypothetical predicted protein [Lecanosticta acicola]
MPPIQVHIDDPITPKKEAEAPVQQSPYPAARPGAPAVPAPTPYVPNPQSQPQPTRTTPATSNHGPPPPQPGAVPVAPASQQQQQIPMTAPPSNLPSPPKAGERPPPTTTMPAQMGVPPPTQQANVRGTSAYSPPERAGGPTTVNFGAAPQPIPAAASHPPGYQQDTNAQEMSSAARASLDAQERKDGMGGFGGNFGGGSSSGGGGLGGGDGAGDMWTAVKGWVGKAGETLAETEREVWRRIGNNN